MNSGTKRQCREIEKKIEKETKKSDDKTNQKMEINKKKLAIAKKTRGG